MIAPNESAEIWEERLKALKSRGVERISLFCIDGLSGMENVIQDIFPGFKIQRCLVHIQRNICAKVRVNDRKEEALTTLKKFIDKWKHIYPSMVKSLSNNDYLFTFYDYPESVRHNL